MTDPIPNKLVATPTLHQLRQQCQMSIHQLATVSGLRPSLIYWMEVGISVHRVDAIRVLHVLSQRAGCHYRVQDIRGLHLKEAQEYF